MKNEKLEVKRIDIDPMYQAWDFIVKGKKVYFLTSLQEHKKYKNIVFELDINNLHKKAKKKFYFYSDTFARSFESLGNDFYFGLGVNIKSQRKWKQKELDNDTGKVLRIKNSL